MTTTERKVEEASMVYAEDLGETIYRLCTPK